MAVTHLYFRRKRVLGKEIEARNDVWRMINGFQIVDMDGAMLQRSKDDTKFRDFEDAMQYYSAKSRCDTIIMRNKRDLLHKDVKVQSPEEFLYHKVLILLFVILCSLSMCSRSAFFDSKYAPHMPQLDVVPVIGRTSQDFPIRLYEISPVIVIQRVQARARLSASSSGTGCILPPRAPDVK